MIEDINHHQTLYNGSLESVEKINICTPSHFVLFISMINWGNTVTTG